MCSLLGRVASLIGLSWVSATSFVLDIRCHFAGEPDGEGGLVRASVWTNVAWLFMSSMAAVARPVVSCVRGSKSPAPGMVAMSDVPWLPAPRAVALTNSVTFCSSCSSSATVEAATVVIQCFDCRIYFHIWLTHVEWQCLTGSWSAVWWVPVTITFSLRS